MGFCFRFIYRLRYALGVSKPARAHLLMRHSGLQLGYIRIAKLDLERAQVFLQVLHVLGAGDGDDVLAARLQRAARVVLGLSLVRPQLLSLGDACMHMA